LVKLTMAEKGEYTLEEANDGLKDRKYNENDCGHAFVEVRAWICEIYEDSYENGELGRTGAGMNGGAKGRYRSFEDVINDFSKEYGLSSDPAHWIITFNGARWQLETARQVADHTEAQNGGWMPPTKTEIVEWMQGEYKLYSENWVVYCNRLRIIELD
tara:strand:+ start:347 stop:820 length:474 start_codon:yes stop_codon:yes gene_type:complete